jgi:Histidine kinase
MSTPMPPLPTVPTDRPLPVELTGSAQGWFGRYRRYPVFSAPWVRGRLQAWSVPLALFLGLVGLGAFGVASDTPPWGAFVQITLSLALPMVLGPWLGHAVRRCGWAPTREGRALAAAMAGVVLAMLVLQHLGAEPLKQFIAEQTGEVDASGKRKKVLLSVGVSVSDAVPRSAATAAAPASAAAAGALQDDAPPESHPVQTALNLLTISLITFWMAGGMALWGRRRELAGLAALQRERELAAAQAQRRDAELRLSVLAAQVEPHFLFNTLAGVRSAIATDPARASDMVDGLVDYLRASIPRLRSDGAAQVTVAGQFDIVRAYLGLMAARMPRLQFSVQAPDDLLRAHCPPLMLISLAENAVRHGVEMKIGPARIDVSAEHLDDGRLMVSVVDDGVGFGVSQSGSGIGLVNIRERLAQLYGSRAELTLKARTGGGVVAALVLPLEWPDAAP